VNGLSCAQVIRDRAVLTDKEHELQQQCESGQALEKPQHWGGRTNHTSVNRGVIPNNLDPGGSALIWLCADPIWNTDPDLGGTR
jgi:hypothetical protein